MIFRHKILFWISLGCLLFGFFRWLFGIAIPEIALEFSLGTAFILVAGLLTGHVLTSLAIRSNAVENPSRILYLSAGIAIAGFVAVAFLLNSMIEKTTLFPFAITILLLYLITAAAGSFVTLIRHQYKRKITSAQAAMAQSKSELQLLQSQLSPHFLFNTLNNLYGLSLSEPNRVPPLLLKLSDLLRYSVYDVKDVLIPLQYEIDYLNNYIEFERLRLGPRLTLLLNLTTETEGKCKIPPLLLIVFVENAFKHSRNTGDDTIQIDISLRKDGNSIVFSISNSYSPTSRNKKMEKNSGFGLDSVRKRLGLLYAGKHHLVINEAEGKYTVQLTLECQ